MVARGGGAIVNQTSMAAYMEAGAYSVTKLALIGMTSVKIKLAYMYMSLFVGLILLTAVNIELILRSLITLGGRGDELAPLAELDIPGAE